MKGAFDIEIRRNGKLLKHNFNNRILKSGLEFQEKYSVSNATDSIITHLLLGGVHSNVTADTTAMDSTPLVAVPYIDYIKPDFTDQKKSMFMNELVFKFEPTETIIIKQLATGRKNVTVIGGIESVSYDYFSLANVMQDGERAEIKLFPGDSLTVTYKLLVNTATNFSKELNAALMAWEVLTANPNWHLCGYNRRMQVAKEVLQSYWEINLNPWVYEKNLTSSSTTQRYFYSRIMWQLPDGMTMEEAKANVRLKRTMDFGGAFPIWNDNGGPYIYNINGKLHMEGTTSSLYQGLPVNELDRMYVADIVGTERPTVGKLKSEIEWTQIKPKVNLVVKCSPLSLVLIKHGNQVIKSLSGNIGYGAGNIGRSDKQGIYKHQLTNEEANNLDRNIPFTATVINHNGYVESEQFFLTLPDHRGWGRVDKAQYDIDGNFSVRVYTTAWNWRDPEAWRPNVDMTVRLVQRGENGVVAHIETKTISSTYSQTDYKDTIFNFTLPVNPERDYLDGTWVITVNASNLINSTVSYEIPLEKSVVTSPLTYASSGLGYPPIEAANVRKSGISERVYSKLTITKK